MKPTAESGAGMALTRVSFGRWRISEASQLRPPSGSLRTQHPMTMLDKQLKTMGESRDMHPLSVGSLVYIATLWQQVHILLLLPVINQ